MKKTRILCLLLALFLAFSAASCALSLPAPEPKPFEAVLPLLPDEPEEPAMPPEEPAESPEEPAAVPVEGEYYYELEDVILYIDRYGRLPDNFITKKAAHSAGWSGGPVDKYIAGAVIGGDRFGNSEGLLPAGKYRECDIGTLGAKKRGARRLIYSDDGRYYYTDDHYDSFTRYAVENGAVAVKEVIK
ncbi:MAG: ribonuclease [Oscillospiraceae bacterium]|nr:ribonuclease [Oscillospiraceae bacterium]